MSSSPQTQAGQPSESGPGPVSIPGFDRVEFLRHGLALVPDPADKRPGLPLLLLGRDSLPELRSCSCARSKTRTCDHVLELVGLYRSFLESRGGRSPYDLFKASLWHKLSTVLARRGEPLLERVGLSSVRDGRGGWIGISGPDGEELARYLSSGPDAGRLVERLGPAGGEDQVPGRSEILKRLALRTLTQDERSLIERGYKSQRMALEGSFWYRLAYHCFMEFGPSGITFQPRIEEKTGRFTLLGLGPDQRPVLQLAVPRLEVGSLLAAFRDDLPNQHGLTIHPLPLRSIFKVDLNTELDLEVRPLIQVLQGDGEAFYLDRAEVERFRYGNLIYVKELGLLAELERERGPGRRFKAPVRMRLKKSQVPSFLEEHAAELKEDRFLVGEEVRSLKIFKEFDRIEVDPKALERDWCWLDLRYGFGTGSVSLAELLRAREEGRRYLGLEGGWVDCQAESLSGLEGLGRREIDPADRVRLSRLDLLRLQAAAQTPLRVTGRDQRARLLKRLLSLSPALPGARVKGLTSSLRPYQTIGFEWLRFLSENFLSGLLCDDMGLGKTHQVMALMLWLRESGRSDRPMLVVCPATVLSHWSGKLGEHAPGLRAAVFHGAQREVEDVLAGNDLLLTSYGVLLNDIRRLEEIDWSLVVFDEIQTIKNPQTKTFQAARSLRAGFRLGLTGTPLENRLEDLKALFDLILPGYLGSDQSFQERYAGRDSMPAPTRRAELGRLISPFVLRRLKGSVLEELPDKIEDIRTCRLSQDQVALYREAVSSRGRALAEELKAAGRPIPYIHIFALLNLLKQICDHPALVSDPGEDPERCRSGKWDLFQELLQESLDSGQKVVVYSQYLRMIELIAGHLGRLGVDFVTLTGRSRNRGRIISRFNDDPGCRVFAGSLRAGGLGIDLVAASVVIHYDRWWNAAREDQATDRVHRIGQRRGVQVFKLVTEGTLEEKISALIEKKRRLLEEVVPEDDPRVLKSFSREDLIGFLSFSPPVGE